MSREFMYRVRYHMANDLSMAIWRTMQRHAGEVGYVNAMDRVMQWYGYDYEIDRIKRKLIKARVPYVMNTYLWYDHGLLSSQEIHLHHGEFQDTWDMNMYGTVLKLTLTNCRMISYHP